MHEDHKAVELHAAGQTVTSGWLIAGVSGRALAQSAERGGYRVVVLDYFADRDCQEAAAECRAVCSGSGLRFDTAALLQQAELLAPADQSIGLIYGSGFENRIHLLQKLAAGRVLCGNSASTIRLLKDPRRFFPLLARLGIPYPETRLDRPTRGDAWLAKESGGAGGVHIRNAAGAQPTSRTYYQRLVSGRNLSVTFLASGTRAAIIGINQQWTTGPGSSFPYQFGGAVGGISLPLKIRRELAGQLDRLVEATGMVGLNGLDFQLARDSWQVLEVNPRPTATVELYDRDYPRGLFDWHLRACRGELPIRVPVPRASRALTIVIAAEPWESSAEFEFPRWCRDLPRLGLRFSPGDPICTVHASAPTPGAARELLERRKSGLLRMLSATTAGV